ncbi:hypothetical protein QE406_002902 [Microbacterium testaceum]|nr:hypothetical protein [Microbacterium sp. SORGH_AS_0969]MDQ1116893.1 hypothetical protein [Microbacterium testaceum]
MGRTELTRPSHPHVLAYKPPSWSINLSLPAGRVASGIEYPGDLFYREDDGGLCLVDVAWWTVQ